MSAIKNTHTHREVSECVCKFKIERKKAQNSGPLIAAKSFFLFLWHFFSFLSLFLFFFSHFISAFLGPRIVCECVFVGRRQRWRLRWRRRNTLRHTHFRVVSNMNNQSDCSFALSVCIFESTYAGEFTHYSKNFQVS